LTAAAAQGCDRRIVMMVVVVLADADFCVMKEKTYPCSVTKSKSIGIQVENVVRQKHQHLPTNTAGK
jgi:hypothetical protein